MISTSHRRSISCLTAALGALAAALAPAPVAASAPPLNDDRAQALILATGVTRTATNVDSTTEPGEVLACEGVQYRGTIWFVWRATEVGDATFEISGMLNVSFPADTMLAVYRGTQASPVACNNDAGLSRGPSRLTLRVAPGDYLIQAGAPSNGAIFGEGDMTARVGFEPDLDLDRDTWARPGDCNDRIPRSIPAWSTCPMTG